jgi:ribosomal protein S18 acetylase RimI-like enzyme
MIAREGVIMEIRAAERADLPRLVAALRQSEFFTERFDRQQRGHGLLLIAWRERAPVGTVYLWLEPAEEPELRKYLPDTPLVTHLEVGERFRRTGIGTALLHECHRLLVERGHRQVALGVRLENVDAIRLYKNLGYAQWPHPEVETIEDRFQVFVKQLR